MTTKPQPPADPLAAAIERLLLKNPRMETAEDAKQWLRQKHLRTERRKALAAENAKLVAQKLSRRT